MLKPINVIFNADDLGYHHLRDDAIIEAKLNGVVTSASLMVNGKSAASAVGKAASRAADGIALEHYRRKTSLTA